MSSGNEHVKGPSSWRYALGRVAALEARLLDRQTLSQLPELADTAALLRLLQERAYEGETVEDMLLTAAEADLRFLTEVQPEPRWTEFWLLGAAVQNLKACLKLSLPARLALTAEDCAPLMHKPSRYLAEDFLPYLQALSENEDAQSDLPNWLQEAAREARRNYRASYDLSLIDLSCDYRFYAEQARLASELENDWLCAYLRQTRDLINLESVLRARCLALGEAVLRSSLLPLGDLSLNELLTLFEAEKSEWAGLMERGNLARYALLREQILGYGESGGAARFNQAADAYKQRHLSTARLKGASAERVLAYLFTRELERRNIRLAEHGLANHIAAERIQSLMRLTV